MATTVDRTAAPANRLGYQPAIDGLRAVSVAAVVLYHADVSWMPGGFLGVEVFFVVSGFLITSLLVEERHHSGSVSLRNFWMRRARRLLPALYLLLAVVSVAALVVYRDAAGRMGGDVLAAVFYVHNWWQILQDQSYFAQAGRPPLLQHLWSLSIEEQFYLLFPPILAVAMARVVRSRIAWVLVGLAVASAVYMAVLYEPYTDPSRVYYSTFTRASGMLLGAMLALVWAPWRTRGRAAPSAGPALNLAGVLGLVLIGWFFTRVNAFDPFIYRGGFLMLDLVCILVIAVLVHPSASLGRVLGLPPLVWLGQRSYAIYLWHWPIFMVTRSELDVTLSGWPLFVLRVGLTLGAAELSYRYVEQPMRHGALGDWWRRFRSSSGMERRFAQRRAATVAGIGVLLGALIAWGLHSAASSPEREQLALEAASALPGLEGESASEQSPTTTSAGASAATPDGGADGATPDGTAAGGGAPGTDVESATSVPQGVTTATNAVAVGDSVLLGSQQELKDAMPGIRVDAKVARQFDAILDTVRWYASEGLLPGPLIVHAGTNGTFSDEDLDELFDIAGDRRVLLVNAKVERPWQDLVNERLAAAADRHDNAVLVDWHSLAEEHPEWFAEDGAHLRPEGAQALAQLIARNLR